MPVVDWTFLAKINLWQIAIVIVALFVLTRLLMRFWPWLKKVIFVTDSIGRLVSMSTVIEQLPAFIERTDTAIADIRHEVKFNNGSSVKDAIGRVERGVKGLHEKVDEQKKTLDAADAALRKDLEDTRPHPPRPRRPQQKK